MMTFTDRERRDRERPPAYARLAEVEDRPPRGRFRMPPQLSLLQPHAGGDQREADREDGRDGDEHDQARVRILQQPREDRDDQRNEGDRRRGGDQRAGDRKRVAGERVEP